MRCLGRTQNYQVACVLFAMTSSFPWVTCFFILIQMEPPYDGFAQKMLTVFLQCHVLTMDRSSSLQLSHRRPYQQRRCRWRPGTPRCTTGLCDPLANDHTCSRRASRSKADEEPDSAPVPQLIMVQFARMCGRTGTESRGGWIHPQPHGHCGQ